MRETAKKVFSVLENCGFKEIPGWITYLYRLGFKDEEVVEIMDNENINMKYKHSDDYYRTQLAEWKKEDGFFDMVAETYKEIIKSLKEDYRKICDDNYRLDKEQNVPYSERKLILEIRGLQDVEDKIKKFTMKFRVLRYSGKSEITPDMIARAREYPIERFVETQRGYIVCPFHNDRNPSMWIKNNFGYCFSCGAYADSIELIMKTKGVLFKDAVKLLQ